MPFFSGRYCEILAGTNSTLLEECLSEVRLHDLWIGIPALLLTLIIIIYFLRKDLKNTEGGKNE